MSGQLSPDDLVWRDDMKEWRKASSVKGLFFEHHATSPVDLTPESSSVESTQPQLIWKHPIVIALSFILCWPVGAYLLWKLRTGTSGASLAIPGIPKKWLFLGGGTMAALIVLGTILTVIQTNAARNEIADAAILWEKGQHDEAIVVYQLVISKRGPFIPGDQEALVYGRVIDHLSQHNRNQEARLVLEKLNRLSSSATPLIESESGRNLMADIRREHEAERQQREAAKREQENKGGASENQLANMDDDQFVSASKLYQEFNSNEVAADEKYTGQRILVSGNVQSVENATFLGTIIYLTHGDYGELGIHCLLSRSSARSDVLKTVNAGDYIKVRGQCDGKSFIGVVMLSNCDFVNVTGN
jgi:hypothetical protein